MSVALVGDSFISRLDDHLRLSGIHGLNLPEQCSAAVCFGRGGASVIGRKPIQPLLYAALRLHDLKALYIHVGSNDLSDSALAPATLAQRIFSLANYALASSDALVCIIGQIHTRAPSRDSRYNDRDTALRLVLAADSRRLSFATSHGLCRTPPDYFTDGTHFTAHASRKFIRGVRGAMIRAFKRAADPSFPTWMPKLR